MTVLEKQPSPELLSLIKAAAQSLLGFGELWNSIKMKGKDEGFSERELQDILRPLLKPQLNKDQIYYLFNAETKKAQSKETYNKLTENRNITTVPPTKVIEQKTNWDEEVEDLLKKEVPVKDSTQFYKEQVGLGQGEPPLTTVEEEPTPLELANIRIAQLEDVVKKFENFKPAAALEATPTVFRVTDESVIFDWLAKRHDGVGFFWFPNYGRVLFKNRIMSQLENSGVKTFKRLYFEI